MNKHIYIIIGLLIGLLISGVSVYGAGKLYANNISVDTSNMSDLGSTSDVNAALTYLYGKASQIGSTIKNGISTEAPGDSDTYLGIVYLNPTNLDAQCTSSNSVSTTGTKTGCMKWYVYNETDDSYIAILDHNTTAKVAYNSNNVNTSQKEVATQLTSDISSWNSSLKPRLITAEEIVKITKADKLLGFSVPSSSSDWFYLDGERGTNGKWQTQVATSQGASHYAWLFDYTNSCTSWGCNVADSSTYGYWTSTSMNGSGSYVWNVRYYGRLDGNSASNADYGVRPVITISKSILS